MSATKYKFLFVGSRVRVLKWTGIICTAELSFHCILLQWGHLAFDDIESSDRKTCVGLGNFQKSNIVVWSDWAVQSVSCKCWHTYLKYISIHTHIAVTYIIFLWLILEQPQAWKRNNSLPDSKSQLISFFFYVPWGPATSLEWSIFMKILLISLIMFACPHQ